MTKFDPKHAEEHGYTKADWDALYAPEATDEELASAAPFREVLPDVATPKRKNPKKA